MFIQRGYRALVLWIVWAAASILIYTQLYIDTDVWEFVQSDPSRITWVIIGLFLFGVFGSLFLTVLLTYESVHADVLAKVAKTQGWPGIVDSAKRLKIARYFESIETIIDRNGKVDINALIDVEFASYHRFAHFLEVIGNLLITLGLIGTVVGLTLTLTGLTGSLEALGQDQDQLLAGLRRAMGGMGTAFYTTLLGSVLGGVLLRVFSHIAQSGVDSLEDTLARMCIVYCAQEVEPSLRRDVRLLSHELDHLDHTFANLQKRFEINNSLFSDYKSELSDLKELKEYQQSLRETMELQTRYLVELDKSIRHQRALKGSFLGRIFRKK